MGTHVRTECFISTIQLIQLNVTLFKRLRLNLFKNMVLSDLFQYLYDRKIIHLNYNAYNYSYHVSYHKAQCFAATLFLSQIK